MEAKEILANIAFTTSGALVDYVDKKVVVILRDGKKLIGILRSYDQFANFMLQETIERVFLGNRYADVPKGLYIIRGENVVLLGELDLDMEDELPKATASPIPASAAQKLLEAVAAENQSKEKLDKRRIAVLRRDFGFSGEGAEGDSY
ncbi:Lsm1p [Malassezia vespertilionis]|uniref:U6 snRNA-associated Sm-like protein LSm1 n=1 Tax=Malassezia vespertilionis TaxID=2020962 RepID=A0A2N1JFF7_9BASI|nr:Lsm1p [Malassezia vespertilionis]